MPSEQQPKQVSELEKILSYLSNQNSRYVSLLSALSDIGNKGRNTRLPAQEDGKSPQPPPEGLFQEINFQLDYMTGHNNQLEELVGKFSSLI